MRRFRQFLLFIALVTCMNACAQNSSAKPGSTDDMSVYTHALADLQLMRAYLDSARTGDRNDPQVQSVLIEIDSAIRDIMDAFPGIQFDPRSGRPSRYEYATGIERLSLARDAGKAAERDVRAEIDWNVGGGLRQRVLNRLNLAVRSLDRLIGHGR